MQTDLLVPWNMMVTHVRRVTDDKIVTSRLILRRRSARKICNFQIQSCLPPDVYGRLAITAVDFETLCLFYSGLSDRLKKSRIESTCPESRVKKTQPLVSRY